MIIRKIRIKNINSLKNEHIVDFTTSPLKESGLFAITGPTGSGKTTILDAICLALFNRIPRIDKQISQNLIIETGVILTRNTKDAVAEVEYSCAKGIYTSRWEISTNRNGNLRDSEMRIYDVAGNTIEEKKKNVPVLNEQLVGLSFDQFIRSILLPQGDFALFLQSGKNDRGILLEKITGSLIYRELGKRAYEKRKIVCLQMDKIKDQQSELLARKMDDTAFAELEVKCNSIAKEQVELNNKMVATEKQLDIKQNIERLTKQVIETEMLWKKSIQDSVQFIKGEGVKMKPHKLLLPYFEEINAVTELQNWIATNSRKIEEIKTNLAQNETKIENTANSIRQFVHNQTIESSNLVASLDQFEQKVIGLSSLCDQKEFAYRTGFEPVKQTAKELNLPILIKEEPHKISEKISHRKQAIIHQLSEYELKHPKIGVENSLEKQTLFQEQISLATEWDKMIAIYEQNNKSLQLLLKKRLDTEKEHKTGKSNLEQWNIQFNELKTHLELKSKDLLINQLTTKLEDFKKHLHNNQPCPLCGSLEHPWAEKEIPDSKSQEYECKQLEEKLKIVKSSIDSAIAKNELFEKQIENTLKEEKELGIQIATSQHDMDAIKTKLPEDMQLLKPAEATSKLQQYLAEYRGYGQLVIELEKIEQIKLQISKLIELFTEGKEIRLQLQAIYQGNNIQTDCKALRSKYQEVESEKSRLNKNLQEIGTELERNEISKSQKIGSLLPKLQQIGFTDFEIAKKSMLHHSEYTKLEERAKQLENEKLSRKTKYETLVEQLKLSQQKDVKETLEQIRLQLTQFSEKLKEIAQNRDAMMEQLSNQKSIRADLKIKEQEYESLRLKSEKWILLDKVIGDSQGYNFNNFAQSLTLGHLITLANRRLQELSPRYMLTKTEVKGNDELNVIDRDMGDELRSVKTLSGGETFMVSLALALGLAEMASRNIAIGSLFIDEGFGTLDPETLDQALAMLEQLQARNNKTIGIISHVDALKERINARIELHPEFGQGHSKLVIKSGY
ncbi:MAG: SbcC/MukB-like Walker B domain-containing protein [Salinivirgaceae bacterium]|nr:SbcC/MukB-like Walker B domain-containing protein [Salinivirgaceae bacterium]